MKVWKTALERIAACNNGEGYCQTIAREALEACSGDPLHPFGRCECFGEGQCDWCKRADEAHEARLPGDPASRESAHGVVFDFGSRLSVAESKVSMLHDRLLELETRLLALESSGGGADSGGTE